MAINLPAEPRPKNPRSLVALYLKEVASAITDPFMVIERGPQHFIQCLNQDTGWRLEKREGDAGAHFLAFVAGTQRMMLKDNEVEDALVAYLEETPDPDWLEWQSIEV